MSKCVTRFSAPGIQSVGKHGRRTLFSATQTNHRRAKYTQGKRAVREVMAHERL
jgi:hypothetical protein